jgi:hypothetical protein
MAKVLKVGIKKIRNFFFFFFKAKVNIGMFFGVEKHKKPPLRGWKKNTTEMFQSLLACKKSFTYRRHEGWKKGFARLLLDGRGGFTKASRGVEFHFSDCFSCPNL